MASLIENLFNTPASVVSGTDSFRRVIEDHLEYFRAHSSTQVVPVNAHDAHVYMFDWIGLLNRLNVPTELHWLTIRLNGGLSFIDFDENTRSLLVPDQTEYNKILQMHVSARKKN